MEPDVIDALTAAFARGMTDDEAEGFARTRARVEPELDDRPRPRDGRCRRRRWRSS